MADIKQAAKWMREGHKVRRPDYFGNFAYLMHTDEAHRRTLFITTTDNNYADEALNLDDLMSSDWEIAE